MLYTPLHHWHVAHGAKMAECDGWQVPSEYPDEANVTSGGLAITDISPFAKASLRGRGVTKLVRILANEGFSVGRILRLSAADGGKFVIACSLTAGELLLLGGGPRMELRLRGMEIDVSALKCRLSSPEPAIAAVNSTCALAGFSLLGQHWPKVLHRVTSFDVENHLPSGMCAQTNIAGIRALLVRADELQVPSIRIYVACDLAEYVWERLLAAENISLIGLDAWRNLLSGEAASGGC